MTDRDHYLRADRWDSLVLRDPAAVVIEAAQARASFPADHMVIAITSGAEARALFDLGRLAEARDSARRAVGALEHDVGLELRLAVSMSAAVILAESGDVDLGVRTLAAVIEETEGDHLARALIQRAYIESQGGRLNDAIASLEAAERVLGSGAEPRDQFRLHQIRGLVLLQQGRLDAADDDFRASQRVAEAAGLTGSIALSLASRAVLEGRARRLSTSIELFDRAAALFEAAGNPRRTVAVAEIDRAEVLLHSGLVVDAVDAARRAVGLVEPTGNQAQIGDARLLVARAELAAGLYRAALASADAAAETFDSSGRGEMVPHARSIAACAMLQRARSAHDAADAIAATADVAHELRSNGWHQLADEFLLERARVANAWSLLDAASPELEHLRLGAWSAQRDLALIGWYTEALSRRRDGDLDAALDACRAGFGPLDDIIDEASTLEQRSAAMRLGRDLSQLAIDCAVEVGDLEVVWAAAEGTRARALHDELAEQRQHRGVDAAGAIALHDEVSARLADRTLVEWVVANDRVFALLLDSSGMRLVDVADVADLARARDRVLLWLDVAATEPDGSSARAVASASDLDRMLLGPLRLTTGDGVVMIPIGPLHRVPWGALPSLLDRPFSLAPNARVWLESDRRAAGPVGSAGFLAGPAVGGGEAERRAFEERVADPHDVVTLGTTAEAVTSMLAEVDLVHIAAHGRFRGDRPLLSTLLLADGEHTLSRTLPERMGARLVVLSSCEGGAQGTSEGGEVLGMASIMLARGAASILAPLTVVRDLECAEFVADVYAELASAEPLACAVANVRSRWLADDDLSRWAVAASFNCYGSGAIRLSR